MVGGIQGSMETQLDFSGQPLTMTSLNPFVSYSLEAQGNDSASTEASASTESLPIRVKRKPIPRKGHTKSRKGCFSCKKRKVKCTEQLPKCQHCERLGLTCEYPALRYHRANETTLTTQASRSSQMVPSPRNALRSSPTSFKMEDMRFFSHFILSAYPSLPLNGDQIWMDVSQMSHEYECLMHSMLALGASHLTLCTSSNYSAQALSHRIRAIGCINQLLSQPDLTTHESDAVFGSLMALVFQSAFLPEGMMDFVSMVRGCALLFFKGVMHPQESHFRSFKREMHMATFLEMVTESYPATPAMEPTSLLESIRALGPLCKSVVELSFVAEMTKAVQMSAENSIIGYAIFSDLYSYFARMSDEDFAMFTNPQNYTAQIILCIFFLVDHCIGESISSEAEQVINFRKHIILIWIERVAASLPPEWVPYIQWTLQFARIMIYGSAPTLPSHWPRNPVEATTKVLIQSGSGVFPAPLPDSSTNSAPGSSSSSSRGASQSPNQGDVIPTFNFDVRMAQALKGRGIDDPSLLPTGAEIVDRWKATGILQ